MADGQNSTLVLQTLDPALSDITFDCSGADSVSSGYLPDLGSLRLNEERRLEIAYSQGAMMDGGLMTSYHGPLVPVTFDVVVSDTTRAGMMQKARALFGVVISDYGGYLKYKPDGVGASVLDTYYHFVKSPVPALAQVAGNRWDKGQKGQGAYRITLKVTLMTQPFATSDPSSLTSLVSGQTLENINDGTGDYHTISAPNIKGSLPALCRVRVVNQVAGSAAAIGRFWLARRTKTLTNFIATYNSATAQPPTGAWSNPSDSGRCGGSYYRCTPVASEQVYALRFTISNWDSHIGRAALLLVCRNNGSALADFDIYYRWTLANYVAYGEAKNTQHILLWEAIILGELDLPETEMSDTEELDLYLDVCVVRKAGSGTFDIDALKLLYTDECALQLDAPSGYGAESTHTLLAENLDEEIAHIYTTSGSKLAYLCSAFGNFLTLLPDRNNRVDVAWLREVAGSFADDFGGYDDLWDRAADGEYTEDWLDGSSNYINESTSHAVEGDYYSTGWGVVIDSPATYGVLAGSWDFSRFGDDDYLTLFVYVGGANTNLQIRFDSGPYSYSYNASVSSGDNHLKIKKSDFSSAGSPNWASITEIRLYKAGGYTDEVTVDDMRWVLADPDDAATFNDTGQVWNFPSGTWHVQEEGFGSEKSLSCYDESGETVALLNENFGANVMVRAKVRVRWADGEAGLVFRCSDGTSGSEDMYGFFIDTANDLVELREWVAGSPSDVATAVSYECAYDADYYLGVIVDGTSIQCFISTDLDTLWETSNRKFNTTDATHSSGDVGFVVPSASVARFTDFWVAGYGDKQDPSDTVKLSIDAMFRTIFPFSE